MLRRIGLVVASSAVLTLVACGGGSGSNAGAPAALPSTAPPGALSVDGFSAGFTEYDLPKGATNPAGITVGPDGAVWFVASNGIVRATNNGVTGEFSNSAQNYGKDITSANGRLWFTTAVPTCNTFVTSLTVGGSFATIPFGTMDNDLACNIPGSYVNDHGNVFFSFIGNFVTGIGYVPDGSATFKLLGFPPQNGVAGITVGPDGAIYATAPPALFPGAPPNDALIRCATNGAPCSVMPLDKNAELEVFGIATGVDGNFWMTAQSANAILKVSTGGTILAQYTIPTPNSSPLNIISAPDGTLWFTESKGNNLGRITTSGKITEYPIPTANAAPYGIATCPTQCQNAHGRLWFTEFGTNKVGKLEY